MTKSPAVRVANYNSRRKIEPSYWKTDDVWYLHLPDAREDAEFDGLTANLSNHTIEEHEDGTISVTPSINNAELSLLKIRRLRW